MVSCVIGMVKRDRLEIIAAILDLCSKPRSKTRVMYGTNLSWKMLQQYLAHMQSQGLLEVKDESTKYVTTDRGHDFLEKWKELQELM
jgi:predicted transcriptional regulator